MVVGRGLRPPGKDRREHFALILNGRHLNRSVSNSPFQRLSKASVRRTWVFPSARDEALAAIGEQALTQRSAVGSFLAG